MILVIAQASTVSSLFQFDVFVPVDRNAGQSDTDGGKGQNEGLPLDVENWLAPGQLLAVYAGSFHNLFCPKMYPKMLEIPMQGPCHGIT